MLFFETIQHLPVERTVLENVPLISSNRNFQILLNLAPGVAPVQEQHSQFFNAGSTIDDNLSDKDRLSGRFGFSRPVVFQAPLVGMAGGDGPGTAFMGTLEFRADTFNLTNTPQFQNPRGSVTSSTFGYVTSTQSGGTGVNGTGGGRALQLGLRLTF